MANINITSLNNTNIKKPENLTNIKLNHFTIKVINNNKTLKPLLLFTSPTPLTLSFI